MAGAFCHVGAFLPPSRSLPADSLPVTHSLRRGATSGIFASASTLGAHTFPFGPDGPILEVQRRCTSTVTVCVHGFWLLFMVGTLLALGLSGFSLFCHWVWLLSTLFAGATFAGYWVAQQLEAWLIFWTMWMVHGLLWLQLVLVASTGVWPGTLWANFETHSGTDLLMAQLGSVPLCARAHTCTHARTHASPPAAGPPARPPARPLRVISAGPEQPREHAGCCCRRSPSSPSCGSSAATCRS